MKTNRQARKALGMPYKVSNTRCRTPEDDKYGWPTDRYRKSRRQQRYFAELKRRRGPHTYVWQHTQGERE